MSFVRQPGCLMVLDEADQLAVEIRVFAGTHA
jgi:hypothetical protein